MLQTPVRRRRVHVEQVRAHGHQPAGRPHAQPADVVSGQFTASRLIGERRIKIPVGDHHGSAFQRRTDHFSHVLRPVGGEDQRLRARCDIGAVGFRGVSRLTQQQLTQAAAQCRAARLTRHHDLAACSLHVVTQALDLRGLPYAVNAFERNEQSSHIYPLAHSVRDGGMRRGQAAIAAAATRLYSAVFFAAAPVVLRRPRLDGPAARFSASRRNASAGSMDSAVYCLGTVRFVSPSVM